MQTYHTIVIGGGISGLSLAHYNAKAGHSTLVLEKGDQPGGTFCSHKTQMGEFWFELGAHTCYNSYQNLIALLEDCQLSEQIQPRRKAPFKMIVGTAFKSVFSQIGLFELLFSAPRLFFLNKSGQTVRSYYGRIVGQGNFARTFSAVFSAVPSQKADDFPADMLFKKRARNKEVAKSFTMRHGLQSIAKAIVAQAHIEFVGGQSVESIQRENGVYQIRTTDGTAYQSEHLALATPPPEAAYLLESLAPELAEHLRKIPVAQVESIGVAIAREHIKLEPIAGAIPKDDDFFSIVSRDVFPHATHRGFTFHFAPGLLGHRAKLQRIAEVLKIAPEAIECVREKTNYVPSPRLGHDEWLREIDRLLAASDILLTGNYFAGLSIEDCVTRSKEQFQRLQKS